MINRLFKKLIFHFLKLLLRPLDGRFPRIYMKMYNSLLKMMGVKMDGNPRYISTQVRFDDFDKIHLSERVVISEKVILLTHDYSLTTGLIALGNSPKTDIAFIKKISIGKNVFIGMGAIIMPGTVIHDNVLIGAGSVIRGIIKSDSIVIGNPGQIIGKLTDKAKKWDLQMEGSFIKKDRN
ncbi:acyltransferase [Flavobacterium bomense]|uniref:Acyltransferase n=1 Tax=Flavobacterium bomense TaxID=2497483 RepID=A0A3S0NXW3_9FLAO|nr:acyltransferase [Flavobacterium bomense]RTZ02055.1 acyltransferase [Flavobacterium bomense]